MKPYLLSLILCLLVLKAPAQNVVVDGTDTTKIRKMMNTARKYRADMDEKNFKRAADQLEAAAKATNSHVGLVSASLYHGQIANMRSDYPTALKYALQALDQAKKWHQPYYIPSAYAMIGTVYKENLDYPKAMDAVAHQVEAAQSINDTAQLIGAYLNKAMFMHGYAFNKKDSVMARQSFELHLKGLALANTNPKFDDISIGFYSNIAQYYKDQRDYLSSIRIAEEGVAKAKKYKQFKSLTYQYNWMGESYFKLGQQQKGIDIIKQSLEICKSHGFVFREMEVYSSLEACYVAMGDYKNAWQAKTRWVAINDSLNIIKNVQKLDELNIKYQTAEKNASIKLLNQSEHNKNILFMIGGGMLLLLVVFMIVLSRYNESLLSGNKTIKDQADKLELLLKELHHRVKNNLQIVSSLLKLQSNRLTDEDAVHALRDSQQRIEAMSLIHRTLYQQEDSSLVNMKQFIADLVMSVMTSFGLSCEDINLALKTEINDMNIDQALPLGLIINELVINSFKHAYPAAAKPFKLTINLECRNNCTLEVSDNGPGISPEIWASPRSSFGIKLIKLLTQQLGGTSTLSNNNGTFFKLEMPVQQ